MRIASNVYGQFAAWRRSWYARHPTCQRRLRRPVISVGNLSVGGSGKTPVVQALVRLLLAAGERPAILSRGYGRRHAEAGALVVSDGTRVLEPVERSGDEPQMLARALPGVPVVVCADRHLAGCLAEARLGATVHVLDDGFQHLALWRDIDLLLVSMDDLDDRPLPSGRLREPLASGRVADALLVSGLYDQQDRLKATIPALPVFTIATVPGGPRTVVPFGQPWTGHSASADGNLSPARVVAVAGIAKPERFRVTLERLGWDVAQLLTYRDHHWYTARDVRRIADAARAVGADAVATTEKDAVRLERLLPSSGGTPWVFVPLEINIEPNDLFAAWLVRRLADARARRVGSVQAQAKARSSEAGSSAGGAGVGPLA